MVMRALGEISSVQFTFAEASDGIEALQHFERGETDIIFVDWNMPNMTGIDFVRRVRATQKRHVPIVMITTESTMGRVDEALDDAGVDAYVTKPFTAEALYDKLQPLLQMVAAGQKKEGLLSRMASRLG